MLPQKSVLVPAEPQPQTADPWPDGRSRRELWLLAGLGMLLLGARVLYACNMRLNSDETQHLHVVWAWANGWPEVLAVFDNHTPLFHLLCAPVFRLFGETPMIVVYMRLVMILCVAGALWFTMKIGTSLFSPRAGWWAAILTGFMPYFFLKTVEFRTDDLWTAVWLGTVALAVGGPPTVRRMFCVGLAVGTAFAVSMKTTLLAMALLLAAVVVAVLWRWAGGELRARTLWAGLAACLAGLLVVPGAIVAYYAAHHALDLLYSRAIGHNLLPATAKSSHMAARLIWFPIALPLLICAGRAVFLRTADRVSAAQRSFVLLAAFFFVALLHSYWPMITAQDYPPIIPLFVVLITPGVLAAGPAGVAWGRHWVGLHPLVLPLLLVALEVAVTIRLVKPRPRLGGDLEYLGHVLHFTDPSDYVMDAKSGAIYRRRPFYYALENVTRARMERHLIKDDIVERLIATRTCMAADDRLKGRDLDFVQVNYLPFDHKMRIAGQSLHPDAASGRASFHIAVVARYAIITPRGPAVGTLDGQPYSGSVFLDSGQHEFVCADPRQPHLLVWAQALDRGFQPKFSATLEDAPAGKGDP